MTNFTIGDVITSAKVADGEPATGIVTNLDTFQGRRTYTIVTGEGVHRLVRREGAKIVDGSFADTADGAADAMDAMCSAIADANLASIFPVVTKTGSIGLRDDWSRRKGIVKADENGRFAVQKAIGEFVKEAIR